MTPEELAFRAPLAANPADATARGAFADWLQEHARPVDAALQRVLAQPDDDGRRLEYADAAGGERAEFIRVQCEVPRLNPGACCRACWEGKCDGTDCDHCRLGSLRARERELLEGRGYGWCDGLVGQAKTRGIGKAPPVVTVDYAFPDGTGTNAMWLTFHRGFVERVECPANCWLRWGDAIRERQPVASLRLTTLPLYTLTGNALSVFLGDKLATYLIPLLLDPADRVRECVAAALAERFPGVEFELPPAHSPAWDELTLTPHTIPGLAHVAPELLT